jgi:transcriptional regulator with XRE-family HTH domain
MILKTLEDFGLAIREARKSKNMTQKDLAARLGTTQDWISHLETGRLENPSIVTVLRALGILGIQLDTDLRATSDPLVNTGDLATGEPAFLNRPRQ